MNNLIQDLLSRKKELEIIIKKSKQIIRQAPCGNIRLSKSHNSFQYYLAFKPHDKHDKYIKKSVMRPYCTMNLLENKNL